MDGSGNDGAGWVPGARAHGAGGGHAENAYDGICRAGRADTGHPAGVEPKKPLKANAMLQLLSQPVDRTVLGAGRRVSGRNQFVGAIDRRVCIC